MRNDINELWFWRRENKTCNARFLNWASAPEVMRLALIFSSLDLLLNWKKKNVSVSWNSPAGYCLDLMCVFAHYYFFLSLSLSQLFSATVIDVAQIPAAQQMAFVSSPSARWAAAPSRSSASAYTNTNWYPETGPSSARPLSKMTQGFTRCAAPRTTATKSLTLKCYLVRTRRNNENTLSLMLSIFQTCCFVICKLIVVQENLLNLMSNSPYFSSSDWIQIFF